MPVTLTIKNVPDKLAEHLRAIAAAHHRSLQGELMAIIESVGRLHEAGKVNAAFQNALAESHGKETSPALTRGGSEASSDDLLEKLDAIVAGSQWGEAPVLTRAQANDRALAREFAYQLQEEQN